MTTLIYESKDYLQTLEDIKQRVKTAQIKAHLSVNKEMLILYWQIGQIIVEQRKTKKWGSKIIEQLAKDLKDEFHTMKGFSKRNLEYMGFFAETYPNLLIIQDKNLIVQQPAAQFQQEYFINDKLIIFLNIPWFHNVEIMTKLKHPVQRFWYAQKTIQNGWSRNVLSIQIETDLYKRQGGKEIKANNFALTLPTQDSDLAFDIFKDEYNFEFIDNKYDLLKERAIEKALIDDIIKFLTELGKGFAFVGKQYHLEVAGEDFYIDLLFYHIKLKSYIIVELKTGKFKPEYIGKLGFYLACVDDYLKDERDNNSIGILLCKDENTSNEIKDKSLKCMIRPMGVANYKLAKNEEIPKELEPIEGLKKLI